MNQSISEELQEKIAFEYLTNEDKRISVIAKKLNISEPTVGKYLDIFLKRPTFIIVESKMNK